MNIAFKKYHCLGRDFILLDNRDGIFDTLQSSEIARLCARRFGIGASGILRLDKASKTLIEVKSFNFNGALAEFNAVDAACIAVFAKKLGILSKTTHVKINNETVGCHLVSNHETMHFVNVRIPEPISIKKSFQNFVMDFGTSFCMVPTDDVSKVDVVEQGREISYHKKRFPKGANVTFYQPHQSFLEIRHYEHQADQETYTNGLCAIGVALSHAQNNSIESCLVRGKGGEMQVSFTRSEHTFCDVELRMLVNEVYEGVVGAKHVLPYKK
jgi:diaminopimelate epimerase